MRRGIYTVQASELGYPEHEQRGEQTVADCMLQHPQPASQLVFCRHVDSEARLRADAPHAHVHALAHAAPEPPAQFMSPEAYASLAREREGGGGREEREVPSISRVRLLARCLATARRADALAALASFGPWVCWCTTIGRRPTAENLVLHATDDYPPTQPQSIPPPCCLVRVSQTTTTYHPACHHHLPCRWRSGAAGQQRSSEQLVAHSPSALCVPRPCIPLGLQSHGRE